MKEYAASRFEIILKCNIGGCEFENRMRPTFFPAFFFFFLNINSSEACEKSSRWLWNEKLCQYLCEKARRYMCVTDRYDMTLAVKLALIPNTTNQPIKCNLRNSLYSHLLFVESGKDKQGISVCRLILVYTYCKARNVMKNIVTLSQGTNFRLIQSERVRRRQF